MCQMNLSPFSVREKIILSQSSHLFTPSLANQNAQKRIEINKKMNFDQVTENNN